MKKEMVLIFVVFSIFFSSLVSGACNGNQVIFNLSATTNAHASFYNGPVSYPTSICFDEIFGNTFQGLNPHECSTDIDNVVIRLSGTTNAHVEGPDQTTTSYTNVCYGNLACTLKQNQDCVLANGERFVVALSGSINAHVLSTSSVDSAYNYKLCCKQLGFINNVKWTDINRNDIMFANKSDRVTLLAEGENLLNQEIEFKVYNATKKEVFSATLTATNADLVSTTWQIPKGGVYYFNATLISTGQIKKSADLTVSDEPENSEPIAVIVNPENGDIYRKGILVNFKQASYDFDDLIDKSVWNFGDETNSGNLNGVANTTHSYTAIGQKNILLTVTDERGASSTDSVAITVIDTGLPGDYVVAIISAPEYGQEFNDFKIDLDATQSYAINIGNTGTVSCIAGTCPTKTADGTPISGSPKPLTRLSFRWKTDEGIILDGSSHSAPQDVEFRTPGEHNVDLTVTLDTGSSSSTSVNFFIHTLQSFCYSDDGWQTANWFRGSTFEDSFYDCWREDANSECCPAGYNCDKITDTCKFSGINFCQDYKDENTCTNFAQSVAEYDVSVSSGKVCGGYEEDPDNPSCSLHTTNCACVWNGTDCNSEFVLERVFCETPGPGGGTCQYSGTQRSECVGGLITVSWTARWTGDESISHDFCTSGLRSVPCFTETILPFMSITGIAVAVVLVVIYVFYTKKRKVKLNKNSEE